MKIKPPRRVKNSSVNHPRILVYGFGPYRQFPSNVTMKILRRLTRRKRLTKIVFPVRFKRNQFIDAVQRAKADIIIGLGQCSRGRKLRIEARAVNARRNRKHEPAKKISRIGVSQLKTNLPIDLGTDARRSRFAGDYVCNYSMYVILDFVRRESYDARYGFVHIPHNYDAQRAAQSLNRAIARLTAQT